MASTLTEVGQTQPPAAAHAVVPAKALRAARQFEAILLQSVLGPLEKTFSAIGGEARTPGSDAYQSMGMQAIATTLANHGGIGIAGMVARSLAESGSHR